jgi:hypothetical protein
MDIQKFVSGLPDLYDNWGQESVRPKSDIFHEALQKIQGMTTPNVMQLLNFAVACMEPDEIYCEIGCFRGSTLIGALLNHPNVRAYAVDNFSEFDAQGINESILLDNLTTFGSRDQVLFFNSDFEEFFLDFRQFWQANQGDQEIESFLPQKIGVYLYDGPHDYRSQIMGLLLARDFLADPALIIVDDSNWRPVKQANWDFLAAHRQCQLLMDLPTPNNGHPTFWNGLHLLGWNQEVACHYSLETFQQARDRALIQDIYQLTRWYAPE